MTSVSCASSLTEHNKLSPNSHADNRSKSCDTNCTSNSSCFFKKRKPMNPLAYSMRPTIHKTNNTVKQRVMSAKLLKLRQIQSQLNDANFHLAEVARENQTLKTLQKRQDRALSKYENTNADLPRLIRSHEEEIRVLIEKNKILRKSVKEFSEQLKQKDEELTKAKEQLFHLEKLNKDKHLTEREKLTDKMEDYKIRLQKTEEHVTTLNRKLMLESKTSKQRMNAEIIKHKQCQKELLHAFDEIDRLMGLLDAKENIVRPRNLKFNNKLLSKDSISTSSLKHYQTPYRNSSHHEKLNSQTPVTEVKLEPIANGNTEIVNRKNQNGFKAPLENIKQRLSSSGSIKPQDNSSANQNLDISTDSRDNSAGSFKSRPNSSLKLEKLPSVHENQRIRTKMKKEDTIKKEKEEKEWLEQNGKVGTDDDSTSDAEEYLEDKDVIVRYDHKKDGNPPLSHGTYRDKPTNSIEHDTSDQGDFKLLDQPKTNESEGDFLEMLDKMQKEHEEESSSKKPQGRQKRRSSNKSGSLTQYSQNDNKEIGHLVDNLDVAIQRATQNSKEEFDTNLGDYCSDVLNSVKSCSKAINIHNESLKHSKNDTDILVDAFRKTEKVESRLKKSFFNMEDDMDFVHEILDEEHKFQIENKNPKSSTHDNNNTALVNLENKKKLLATLRAIDNGDSVESIEEPKKQETIMKEIFGKETNYEGKKVAH